MKEGGVKELTPPTLDACDLDVPADLLTFQVERPPSHGQLVRNTQGRAGAQVMTFTLQELRQGEEADGPGPRSWGPILQTEPLFWVCILPAGMTVLYVHDDSDTLEDGVLLQLSDGVHSVGGSARVTVLPVNDNMPHLVRYAQGTGECSFISDYYLKK